MTSCCPPSAWGKLLNPDYVPVGVVEKAAEDLHVYRVGNTSRCIIWNYDIFGFNGGRTRQLADLMATKGFMVLVPDYYRGKMLDPSQASQNELVSFLKAQSDWENQLKGDWLAIKSYAEAHGAQTFGSLGTCWGSYMVLKLSALDEFKAGVSYHPSHSPISAMLGEDEEQLLRAVKCPQMFTPAGDDHPNVKKGGLGAQVLGEALDIIEFPEMKHGWTTRGDLSLPAVDRDVNKALDLALAFFSRHVQ